MEKHFVGRKGKDSYRIEVIPKDFEIHGEKDHGHQT